MITCCIILMLTVRIEIVIWNNRMTNKRSPYWKLVRYIIISWCIFSGGTSSGCMVMSQRCTYVNTAHDLLLACHNYWYYSFTPIIYRPLWKKSKYEIIYNFWKTYVPVTNECYCYIFELHVLVRNLLFILRFM